MGTAASTLIEDERKLLTDVHARSGSGTAPGEAPQERELVAALNVLGLRLLGAMAETSAQDPGSAPGAASTLIVSPPLVALLLCAVAAAATLEGPEKLIPDISTVAEELIDVATLPIVDPAVFQAVAAVCQLALLAPASSVEFVAGLSMWFSGQLAADISPAFSETLSTVLGVEVCELTGPNAAPLDGWAALRSGERIACVFDRFDAAGVNLVRSGCFLLASVVSLTVHLPATTTERSFFNIPRKAQAACTMMTLAQRPTRYVEVWAKEPSEDGLSLGHLVADPDLLLVIPQGLAAQIIEYPIDDSFEAIIILPSAAFGLPRLAHALSAHPARWAVWTGALRQRDVAVKLPTFRIESTNKFKEPLKALGLREAFREDADGMFARAIGGPLAFENLYVSGVLEVGPVPEENPSGVAAGMGGGLGGGGVPIKGAAGGYPGGAAGASASALVAVGPREVPRVPFGVAVNRPFLFVVRECTTGTIVMASQVSQPQLLGLAQASDRAAAAAAAVRGSGGPAAAVPGIALRIAGGGGSGSGPSPPADA